MAFIWNQALLLAPGFFIYVSLHCCLSALQILVLVSSAFSFTIFVACDTIGIAWGISIKSIDEPFIASGNL
jgi:hypothetical protein